MESKDISCSRSLLYYFMFSRPPPVLFKERVYDSIFV